MRGVGGPGVEGRGGGLSSSLKSSAMLAVPWMYAVHIAAFLVCSGANEGKMEEAARGVSKVVGGR